MIVTTSSGGGGGSGSYFKFNKDLFNNIGKTVNELEGIFHQVFKQISYFQEKLDVQNGKAASALKGSLNSHLELMGKSAPVLLHFVDVMKSFMAMIAATDDSDMGSIAPTGRAEWQYSLSVKRTEEEIKLDAVTLKEASISFKANLSHMDDLFVSFNTLINEVISETSLPWEDFTIVWSEAQSRVKSIMETTKMHIEQLLKEVEVFVKEILRLDHMASKMKIAL